MSNRIFEIHPELKEPEKLQLPLSRQLMIQEFYSLILLYIVFFSYAFPLYIVKKVILT
jgi:hypothetical protein